MSGRMGHEVKVGEKISTQINIHEVHQLPRYYSKDEKFNNESENKAMKKYDTVCAEIDFDECIQKELTRQMISATEDKCLVPWFPTQFSMEQIGDHNVCTKEKDVNASYWVYWNQITNQKNDCNKPCKKIVVSTGGKNYHYDGSKNYGSIRFYFSMTSTKTMEHYLYTFTNLFAEVGGYVGLLLGYSCLDFAATIRHAVEKKPWRQFSI